MKITLKDRHLNYLFGFLVLVFAAVLLRAAWMGDDAFITMRTVDNFVNGYGLRWNILERVQSFTHPLWLFLITPFYFFTREPYFTTLAISFVLSFITMYLLVFKVAKTQNTAVVALATLIFSKSFVEYAVSGLENPLTYLLVTIFCIIYFQKNKTYRWLFWLSFVAAFSLLNRLDTLLLYAPALLYALWQTPNKKKGCVYLVLGSFPIILWEIFSLLYYGYLLPNTAYAKLSTGVSVFTYIAQGMHYFVDSILTDPITLIAMITSAIFVIKAKEKKHLALIVGMTLYLLYILKIGGDFMGGRFFAVPFVLAVVTISNLISVKKKTVYICVAGLFVYGLLNPLSPIRNIVDCENFQQELEVKNPLYYNHGITDERWFYYCDNGFMRFFDGVYVPAGKRQRSEEKMIKVSGNIGKDGYYFGPNAYLIDLFALANPLFSHMNIVEKRRTTEMAYGWRIGHFHRPIPFGYLETLEEGVNVIQSEKIAKLYDIVTLITRGDVFSGERLKAVIDMNLGKYDDYSDFTGDIAFTDIDEIELRKSSDAPLNNERDTWYYADTVIVDLHGKQFVKSMDISLVAGDNYEITYMDGDKELVSMVIKDLPNTYEIDGLTPYGFEVPEVVSSIGFDKLKIIHTSGPSGFYLGRVVLNQ